MRERDIEQAVCDYARSNGVTTRKFVSPGHSFVPDRIFHHNGKTWYIEFKAPGKKPSAGQLREHERLRESGVQVFVVDNIPSGTKIIDKMMGAR